MNLKQKTVSGILWSSVDNAVSQGITFVVGIILARLLTPEEFGLIGMIMIFIAVSESFVRSGFSEALIRKKNCTQSDYSTVFYYNLFIGVLFYIVLFLLAPAISRFFEEPVLKEIIRVLTLVLIINATSIIQSAILVKRVDFKLLTRITVVSSLSSGFLAIIMAYKGFGVWSLVALTLTRQAIHALFLWIWNRWRPVLVFSKASFRELFGFGSKLLISGLIDTVYRNIYYLVIGKYFSARELGFYTRAQTFSNFPSQNINMVVNRVTYPILAEVQDDQELLKHGYRKIMKSLMLVTFVLMFGLVAVAEPMVITLIGEKWRSSVIYLQMLCFASVLYPVHALNLNILKVKGRSDLYLKLEIVKKILAIPTIVIGVFYGIKVMIIGMIFNSLFSYYLNSYYSGKLIGYSMIYQLKDIRYSFLLALGMAMAVYFLGYFLDTSYPVTLIIQITAGAIIFFGVCEFTKLADYHYLKSLISDAFLKRK